MMAVEQLFLFALLALILGNGAFKPNISTQVGGLYAPGDRRRDRAYSIFYVGINVGAFLAPLVCGTLGEEAGWHYGFAAAGVGMLIGLVDLSLCDAAVAAGRIAEGEARHTANDARSIATTGAALPPFSCCSFPPPCSGRPTSRAATPSCCGPMPTPTARSACSATARKFQPRGFSPSTRCMIFAFTPFVLALWTRQAARGTEPSTVTKMALGCLGVALSYLIMAAAGWQAGAGKASWLWLLSYFVVVTIGELYLSPVGLSLVTKIAPLRIMSMMMGVGWRQVSSAASSPALSAAFGAGWRSRNSFCW